MRDQEAYIRQPNPLGFMTHARHHQGLGAARRALERSVDWYGPSWRPGLIFEDFQHRAPHLTKIYPASQFKGRLKKPWREKTCDACDKKFMPKREDAKFCSAACRQWAQRQRKKSQGA